MISFRNNGCKLWLLDVEKEVEVVVSGSVFRLGFSFFIFNVTHIIGERQNSISR